MHVLVPEPVQLAQQAYSLIGAGAFKLSFVVLMAKQSPQNANLKNSLLFKKDKWQQSSAWEMFLLLASLSEGRLQMEVKPRLVAIYRGSFD